MGAIDPSPPLAVVIPTLNAAATLGAALSALTLGRELIGETIVADAGSSDGTVPTACEHGARVIATTRGRGQQLSEGAALTRRPWLLFLHADTRLAPEWEAAVRRFIADPMNRRRAGYFRYCLDDDARAARRLERIVNWRSRALGLPYGDQGLLIARAFYDALGGFPGLPLMEDVAFVRCIGKRNLVPLDADAVTSAARYRREGYGIRSLRNLACLGCYFLGVPPRLIQRLYG